MSQNTQAPWSHGVSDHESDVTWKQLLNRKKQSHPVPLVQVTVSRTLSLGPGCVCACVCVSENHLIFQ